jgi:hypothetical protein
MNSKKRPISVLLIACMFIAVGVITFAAGLKTFGHPDFYAVEITETLAIVAGVFMFLGHNWARWLAIAWMAFHVFLTMFQHKYALTHLVIFVLVALILFRSDSRQYFRRPTPTP